MPNEQDVPDTAALSARIMKLENSVTHLVAVMKATHKGIASIAPTPELPRELAAWLDQQQE